MGIVKKFLSSFDGPSYEDASYIQFTHKTCKFGTIVYQMKNIEGFTIVDNSMQFPLKLFLFSLLLIPTVIGVIVPIIILWSYFISKKDNCFVLRLVSGETHYFRSKNIKFLNSLLSCMYKLMNEQIVSANISLTDQSIKVNGDLKANQINTGIQKAS